MTTRRAAGDYRFGVPSVLVRWLPRTMAVRATRRICMAVLAVVVATQAQGQVVKAPSRVITRGDVEWLTYETEEDFARLDDLYRESRESPPQPGRLTTQYFRASTDGSVQPFALWLPRDYRIDERLPLLIQLHGHGPKSLAGRRLSFEGNGIAQSIDKYTPVIIAQPFGRLSAYYQGMAEEDVLETIAEVSRRHAVDPDRVFIMGQSMGGVGAFLVGLHYPDKFGAITPIDAAMGFRDSVDDPSRLPAWMQPQVAIVRPDNLFPNARNVRVFLKNAGAGIQRNSTRYSDGIVAQGGFATMESFPGFPHNFAQQLSYATFVPETIHRPIRRNPPEVKLFTNTLRYNQAYWVTIDRLTRHNQAANVVATYDDGRPPVPQQFGRRGAGVPPGAGQSPMPRPKPPSLRVATENIDALTLRLSGGVVPGNRDLPLTIDGLEVYSGKLPEVIHLAKASGTWQKTEAAPDDHGKRHGVQGPIGDAFNSRFLAVYGEGDGDRELAIAELDALRNPPYEAGNYLPGSGRMVIHGDFPMKPAAGLSKEDIATCNLILFGSTKSHPVLKRLAPALPAGLLGDSGGKDGSVFIHPNPENPDRYVVVWNGRVLSNPDNEMRQAAYIMPVSLLPDYVLLKEGKIHSAGHFDNQWKLRTAP